MNETNSNDLLGDDETPEWAKPGIFDKYRNVFCKVCNESQSDSFPACIKCCHHDELEITEGWHGADEGGGWEIEAVCVTCGKNFFKQSELISDYKFIRK